MANQTITGDLTINGKTTVQTPTGANDAANKNYVDNLSMVPSSNVTVFTTPLANHTYLMTAPSNGVAYVRYSLTPDPNVDNVVGIHLRSANNNDLAYKTDRTYTTGEFFFNATFVMKAGQKLYCYENTFSVNWGQINFVGSGL